MQTIVSSVRIRCITFINFYFYLANISSISLPFKSELKRPLGIVLEEDKATGNVYVETVAPKGNAARSGLVQEGDIVTMCSATFGDQMWSCRGAGLTRVLAAIRIRAGPTVKLVFESTGDTKRKRGNVSKGKAAAEEARQRAQAKKDELLAELQRDEQRLKKGKFLGLF